MMQKQYDCKTAALLLGCTGKTVRVWAKKLFKRRFSFWVFDQNELEILKKNVKEHPGNPNFIKKN